MPARVTAGRIEWRVPDPTCNVYLSLAAVIHAFIDGIAQQRSPGDATEVDAYDAPYIDTSNAKRLLPKSLGAALDALEADTELRSAIGDEICTAFIATKRAEIDAFNAAIHSWEWKHYADRF
jgi:glutamine synthetase